MSLGEPATNKLKTIRVFEEVMNERKEHWEKIYSNKQPHEVSWTQTIPHASLGFIHAFELKPDDGIIDLGGGESRLVDCLLEEGFKDITVLDISEVAIEKSKKRLGNKANDVKWILSDVTAFQPSRKYKVWHDRATFHFLTTEEQIEKYISLARNHVEDCGYLTMGTFSLEGPTKCSGLEIRQYSEESLTRQLCQGFEKLKCITEDHLTPFNTLQNFLFCSFRRTHDN